jgi:hypothetical protein
LLASLPHSLVLNIFARLPPHTRLRCAEVCRAWRAALADGSLWTRLDLRVPVAAADALNGFDPTLPRRQRAWDALLRAAAARAAPAGGLQSLDVRGCYELTHAALLAVVGNNAAALQTVHCGGGRPWERDFSSDEVEALLRAAPALRELDVCAHVRCTLAESRRLLRGEPPFGPVRTRRLVVDFLGDDDDDVPHTVAALLADVTAARTAPCSLGLGHAPLHTPAALNAVVDAALFHRFSALSFDGCDLSPTSAPALARLLSGGSLRQLRIEAYEQLVDAPTAAVLAAALRANTTLTSLRLMMDLWHDIGAATALLEALRAHPTLRFLDVNLNEVGVHAAEAGAALASLIAADAPALHTLNAGSCELGEVGMRAIAEALPANTHLRNLDVSFNDTSPAFVATHMLPAVRANASLYSLDMYERNRGESDADLLVQEALRGRQLESSDEEWDD